MRLSSCPRLDRALDPAVRQDDAHVGAAVRDLDGTDAARSSVNFVVTASSRQRRA